MKKILQISLLLIVAVGVSYAVLQNRKDDLIKKETVSNADVEAISTKEAPIIEEPDVVVTYFTTDVRCKSCRAIEALTRSVVERQYTEALEGGHLVFQTKNIDRAENKHFIDEYQLAFKTVVIALMQDGKEIRFKKMDKVWELLGNQDAFAEYIADGIREFLQQDA